MYQPGPSGWSHLCGFLRFLHFFLFLPFPCSVAILSPVFFPFLGLFRLVCWCCFMSFHCCACFLISCYLILLVFPLSHLHFLPFLFCFSLFFHVYIYIYRLSFLIFSHSLRFILGFRWCSGRGAKKVSREGAVAKCCRVLVRAHASRQGLCGWDKWLWRLQCQWRIPSSQCQALFFHVIILAEFLAVFLWLPDRFAHENAGL